MLIHDGKEENMNWFLICVIAVIAGCGYAGWKKGVLRMAVSLVSVFIAIAATVILSPVIADALKKNTPIYSYIENKVYNMILKDEQINSTADAAIGQEAEKVSEYGEESEEIISYIYKMAENLNIPMSVMTQTDKVIPDNTDISNSMNTVKDQVLRIFAIRLAGVIYNIMVHIIILIIVFLIIKIIVAATDIIGSLPVINQANHVLGVIAGIAEGVIVIWFVFALISLIARTDYGTTLLSYINNSRILTWLNDNNIIAHVLFNDKRI